MDIDSIQKKKLMAKPRKIKKSKRGETKNRLFTFYFFTLPQGTTSFATTDGLATILHIFINQFSEEMERPFKNISRI